MRARQLPPFFDPKQALSTSTLPMVLTEQLRSFLSCGQGRDSQKGEAVTLGGDGLNLLIKGVRLDQGNPGLQYFATTATFAP